MLAFDNAALGNALLTIRRYGPAKILVAIHPLRVGIQASAMMVIRLNNNEPSNLDCVLLSMLEVFHDNRATIGLPCWLRPIYFKYLVNFRE